MNVVLLHSTHKHVSTPHVAILSVMKGSTTVSPSSISILQIPNNAFIHSFRILSDDRSKASSKTIPPHSAI
jgi:hypothetical protein